MASKLTADDKNLGGTGEVTGRKFGCDRGLNVSKLPGFDFVELLVMSVVDLYTFSIGGILDYYTSILYVDSSKEVLVSVRNESFCDIEYLTDEDGSALFDDDGELFV